MLREIDDPMYPYVVVIYHEGASPTVTRCRSRWICNLVLGANAGACQRLRVWRCTNTESRLIIERTFGDPNG